MPTPFAVQLVSPEEILFDGEAEMVVCRSTAGAIAFLYGHVPYLGALADAPLRFVFAGSGEQEAAVHGGFVQMTGDRLVVLSDLAELKEQIDLPRAQRAKAEAEQTLGRDPDDADAQAALQRAETRIAVATGS
ncbi:MAG TPA: ATP synthase F1 subunit epsilon [Acidimicrobiia bacterium]|nr:ATP synthase F1 subunit epsilon [Acidimicrobiia bacterium]